MTTVVIMTLMFLGGRFLNTSMFRQFKSIIVRKKIYQIFFLSKLNYFPFLCDKTQTYKIKSSEETLFRSFFDMKVDYNTTFWKPSSGDSS